MWPEKTPAPTPTAPYAGQRVALLTQHGKERWVAPVLHAALGCQIERVDGFDTDRLGSFTREVARVGSQLDAARQKARIGMQLSGLSLGLASEGSFAPDPFSGQLPWNLELLVFIDEPRGIEVVAQAQGAALHVHGLAADWAQAQALARRAGFPAHHLTLRPDDADDPRVCKGLADWNALQAAFDRALAQSHSGLIFLESDLRAHAHPGRQQHIERAAQALAAKLQTRCPACDCPGFGLIERIPGLPCADCGRPTREPCADLYGCLRCDLRQKRARTDSQLADPARCDTCNP